MEIKTEKKPVFKTTQVQTGTKEVVTFIAFDGESFETERECQLYEKKLTAIKDAEGLITELKLDGDYAKIIVELCFEGYDVSDIQLFSIKGTHNKDIIDKILNYLIAKNARNGYLNFEETIFDKTYLIANWTENINSDYPSYDTKMQEQQDVISLINKMTKSIDLMFEV
jgi:hypothetical protein